MESLGEEVSEKGTFSNRAEKPLRYWFEPNSPFVLLISDINTGYHDGVNKEESKGLALHYIEREIRKLKDVHEQASKKEEFEPGKVQERIDILQIVRQEIEEKGTFSQDLKVRLDYWFTPEDPFVIRIDLQNKDLANAKREVETSNQATYCVRGFEGSGPLIY